MTDFPQTFRSVSSHCGSKSPFPLLISASPALIPSSLSSKSDSDSDSPPVHNRENSILREKPDQNHCEKERLQAKLETLHAANIDLEAELRFKTKAVEQLSDRLNANREEKEGLLEEIQGLEEVIKQLEREKGELQIELAAAQSAKREVNESEQMEEVERELESTKNRLNDVISRHSESERKQIHQLKSLETEISRLSSMTIKLSTKAKQSESELKIVKERNWELSEQLELWKTRTIEAEERLARVREEVDRENVGRLGKLVEEKGKLREELEAVIEELEREKQGGESLQEEFALLSEGFEGRFSTVSEETEGRVATERLQSENEALRIQIKTTEETICALQGELERIQREAVKAKVAYAQAATEVGLLSQQLKSARTRRG